MDESRYLERLSSTGRNEPCPCGSGKKYKKCHMAADEAMRHGDSVKLEEEMAAAADLPDNEKADDAVQKKKPVMSNKQGMGPGYRGNKGKGSQIIPRRSAV